MHFSGPLVACWFFPARRLSLPASWALLPQPWNNGPTLERLAEFIHKRSGSVLTESVANGFKRAVEDNRKRLGLRRWLVVATLAFVLLETSAFVALTVVRYLPSPA